MKTIVFFAFVTFVSASVLEHPFHSVPNEFSFVTSQKNNISLAVYQTQKAYHYALSALQYLESSNIPAKVYLYIYQQLNLGVQNAQAAVEFYQHYQQKVYPHFILEIAVNRVHEALKNFQNAYQYTVDKGVEHEFKQSIIDPIQKAVEAAKNAYEVSQQLNHQPAQAFTFTLSGIYQDVPKSTVYRDNSISNSFFGYGNDVPYFIKQLQQVQKFIQDAIHAVEEDDSIENHSYVVDHLKNVLQHLENIYEVVQQGGSYSSNSYVFVQSKLAFQEFAQAYQYVQQHGNHVVAQKIQLAQQAFQDAYKFIQQGKFYSQNYPGNSEVNWNTKYAQQYQSPYYQGSQNYGFYSPVYPYSVTGYSPYGSGYSPYVPHSSTYNVEPDSPHFTKNVYSNVHPSPQDYDFFHVA